jgi:hypothetical protein
MVTEDNKDIIPSRGEFEILLQSVLSRKVEVDGAVEESSTDWAYLQMLAAGSHSSLTSNICIISSTQLDDHYLLLLKQNDDNSETTNFYSDPITYHLYK